MSVIIKNRQTCVHIRSILWLLLLRESTLEYRILVSYLRYTVRVYLTKDFHPRWFNFITQSNLSSSKLNWTIWVLCRDNFSFSPLFLVFESQNWISSEFLNKSLLPIRFPLKCLHRRQKKKRTVSVSNIHVFSPRNYIPVLNFLPTCLY